MRRARAAVCDATSTRSSVCFETSAAVLRQCCAHLMAATEQAVAEYTHSSTAMRTQVQSRVESCMFSSTSYEYLYFNRVQVA
jgi:hypothetical protein